jgi:hypothetical protein
MIESEDDWAHEFCMEVACRQMRKDSLFAVLPELQLKFQNSEVTVTNWDRVRWFEGPTTKSIRGSPLRQMTKRLSAVSHQLSAKITPGKRRPEALLADS